MSNSAEPIPIHDMLLIGENDHGYEFYVGRVGDRWCGCALGKTAEGERCLFFFSEVGEDHVLGLTDRDQAIRLTGAIACDPGSAYGGITRWYVDEPLRGELEDFRCDCCRHVGCDGRDCHGYEPEFGGP